MRTKMSFICEGDEHPQKGETLFTVEGVSFLHALGLVDAELIKLFGSSLLDNETVAEVTDLLEAEEEGKTEFKRNDFSTPESNWTLRWEVFPMYKVFNKIILGSTEMDDLSRVFNSFDLVTVLATIKEKGRYEDKYHHISIKS